MRYEWGEQARNRKVTAQVVGDEVARITKRQGVCTPGDLVDAAKRKAKLAPLFDFDDVEGAAQRAWEQDARHIINSIRVVTSEKGVRPIAFGHVRLVVNGTVQEGYKPMNEIVTNFDLHEQMKAEALRYLVGFQKRYKDLAELAPVFDAIAVVLAGGQESDAA